MHKNDIWHRICNVLDIDPWQYYGIAVDNENRIQVQERKWRPWEPETTSDAATSQNTSTTAVRSVKRRKPKVKPIYWDYKFVREIADTEDDPVAFLTGTTGCSAGAAKQAIKRARGAEW